MLPRLMLLRALPSGERIPPKTESILESGLVPAHQPAQNNLVSVNQRVGITIIPKIFL